MSAANDFTLSKGEPRVAVLVDESLFVLATDQYPITWMPSARKKRLMIALLETALAEVKAMETEA